MNHSAPDDRTRLLIYPHVHMSARTTDDYEAMRAAGVRAVIEPAFWSSGRPVVLARQTKGPL